MVLMQASRIRLVRAELSPTDDLLYSVICVRVRVVKLTSDTNRQARARRSHQGSSMAIQKRRHSLQRRSTRRYVHSCPCRQAMTRNLPHDDRTTQSPRADSPASGTNGGITGLDFSKVDMEAFESLQPVLEAHIPDRTKGPPIDVSDVADAIVFLASDASKKISGAILPVDEAWSTI